MLASPLSRDCPVDIKRGTVVVIDDDTGTRETFSAALKGAGYTVTVAASGTQAIAVCKTTDPDLLVLDLRLPDMLGLDVISSLHADKITVPFILCSGFTTTAVAVSAMQNGAVDVLDKPVDIDTLLTTVRRGLESEGVHRLALNRRDYSPEFSHSPAERWARYVYVACHADTDPKTLRAWARMSAVSASTLCECCRLIGLKPHDARDFARVLRALMQSSLLKCPPDALFDVSDRRTLRLLSRRAGTALDRYKTMPATDTFMNRQTFVDLDNAGIRALRVLLNAGDPRCGRKWDRLWTTSSGVGDQADETKV